MRTGRKGAVVSERSCLTNLITHHWGGTVCQSRPFKTVAVTIKAQNRGRCVCNQTENPSIPKMGQAQAYLTVQIIINVFDTLHCPVVISRLGLSHNVQYMYNTTKKHFHVMMYFSTQLFMVFSSIPTKWFFGIKTECKFIENKTEINIIKTAESVRTMN